jgi:hypothetical protein
MGTGHDAGQFRWGYAMVEALDDGCFGAMIGGASHLADHPSGIRPTMDTEAYAGLSEVSRIRWCGMSMHCARRRE